jgi:hypothetical protein
MLCEPRSKKSRCHTFYRAILMVALMATFNLDQRQTVAYQEITYHSGTVVVAIPINFSSRGRVVEKVGEATCFLWYFRIRRLIDYKWR